MNKGIIVTDNDQLFCAFKKIVGMPGFMDWDFKYTCTGKALALKYHEVEKVNLKDISPSYFDGVDLVISLHCKQIFPGWLVESKRCINVHPGFNPYNRGWYPQVFSILNGLPTGATIHEIDIELDHGNIIAQQLVEAHAWDTSGSIYKKVIDAEVELLEENLVAILDNSYTSFQPAEEGNINLLQDFKDKKSFDLEKKYTGKEFIDYCRAMTHDSFKNLFFIDEVTKKKVFIQVTLIPE